MTNPQAERAEFLARRRAGIGGSDAAAIIGQDPYKTALAVYQDKVGEVADAAPSPAMQRGRILEDTVVELYSEMTGRKVRKQPQRAHPEYPFLIANIDRQILANGNELGTGLLEVKCPGIRNFLKVQRGGLPIAWAIQGQHYLGVTGYQWMSYAIFNADLWKLIHFDITRDDEFIHKLQAAEARFWKEHVEKKIPPPPISIVGPELETLPAFDGEIQYREDDPAWTEAIEALLQARTLKETAESVEEQAKDRVRELMGERGCVEGAGARIYWRQMPGRKTFDKKALEGAKPLDRLKVLAALKTLPDEPTTEDFNEAFGRCDLNLADFDKVGKPFDEFRAYALKPDPLGDE